MRGRQCTPCAEQQEEVAEGHVCVAATKLASAFSLRRLLTLPPGLGRPAVASLQEFFAAKLPDDAQRAERAVVGARERGHLILHATKLDRSQHSRAHALGTADRDRDRRHTLEGRRKTNPVVDGQLVPKPPREPSSRYKTSERLRRSASAGLRRRQCQWGAARGWRASATARTRRPRPRRIARPPPSPCGCSFRVLRD